MSVLRIVSSSTSFQSKIHESLAIATDLLGHARYWWRPQAVELRSRQHVFSIVESWRRNKLCFIHCLSCLLLDRQFLKMGHLGFGSLLKLFCGVCRRVTDCLKNRCCSVNLKNCQGACFTANDGGHK